MSLQSLPLSQQKVRLVEYENRAYETGYSCVAGVDEAGRGPLAGPVVAAACVIQPGLYFEGINDSKLLSEKRRSFFYNKLTTHSGVCFSISIIGPEIIDSVNIYQATIRAMTEAVDGLAKKPDYLLVDGLKLPHPTVESEKIIKGDQKSHSVAAAGILAKVTRDALMLDYHTSYPEYGFDTHKGYGTKKHKLALKQHGLTPIHRRSFKFKTL